MTTKTLEEYKFDKDFDFSQFEQMQTYYRAKNSNLEIPVLIVATRGTEFAISVRSGCEKVRFVDISEIDVCSILKQLKIRKNNQFYIDARDTIYKRDLGIL